MKHTIIDCDLCNGRIYRDGLFYRATGAVKLRVKALISFTDRFDDIPVTYSSWKRRTLYICPKCVDKIKEICNGGKHDEEA